MASRANARTLEFLANTDGKSLYYKVFTYVHLRTYSYIELRHTYSYPLVGSLGYS